MTIYAISGLGADKRVYQYLTLNQKLIHIEWINPIKNESISQYAKRLSCKIDNTKAFGIIGMSFGGMVAVEISKILNPQFIILISSVETKSDLPYFYKWIGKLNIIKFLPLFLFNPPKQLAYYLFGAKNKKLLKAILDDSDTYFTKWAMNEISRWNNITKIKNCYRIGGTNDKLLPQEKDGKISFIDGGAHFMIVDKAKEVSDILNSTLIVLC